MEQVSLSLDAEAIRCIEDYAKELQTTKSDAARRLIVQGFKHRAVLVPLAQGDGQTIRERFLQNHNRLESEGME